MSFGTDKAYVDIKKVADIVVNARTHRMTTDQIDSLISHTAVNMANHHPDYALLAGRIEMSRLHRNTVTAFSGVTKRLHEDACLDAQYVSDVMYNAHVLDAAIIHQRDYSFDFFAYKTLEGDYLMRSKGIAEERPQHMWMRVAVAIHGRDIQRVLETYDLLSRGFIVHASQTLINAGTKMQQLSTCYALSVDTSAAPAVFKAVGESAKIRGHAGELGLDVAHISHSRPGGRTSSDTPGVVPLLKLFDAAAGYATLDSYKRPEPMTAYLALWHVEIITFIHTQNRDYPDTMRMPYIRTAVWVPDIFMRRVEAGLKWSVFEPEDTPNLRTTYGTKFEIAYERYEAAGGARFTLPAKELMSMICKSQLETGTPFVLYQDAVNAKSNQINIGNVTCAGLCMDIMQHTSPDETAVCAMASIVLPSFVSGDNTVNYDLMHKVVKVTVRNLNRTIDISYHPTQSSTRSALRNRAIGIGVQGLADVFMEMRVPFESPTARHINKQIFETIYHAALDASTDMAADDGPYDTWAGSPAQKGRLQFDLWGATPSNLWEWQSIRQRMQIHGLRNSLLVSVMPTTATCQITTLNDSVSPYASNLRAYRVSNQEVQVVCRWLVRELTAIGKWTPAIIKEIQIAHGSVCRITELPEAIRQIYKTVWEMNPRILVDMAAERGPFICHSQSLKTSIHDKDERLLMELQFRGWKAGLKAGMYLLDTMPVTHHTVANVATTEHTNEDQATRTESTHDPLNQLDAENNVDQV